MLTIIPKVILVGILTEWLIGHNNKGIENLLVFDIAIKSNKVLKDYIISIYSLSGFYIDVLNIDICLGVSSDRVKNKIININNCIGWININNISYRKLLFKITPYQLLNKSVYDKIIEILQKLVNMNSNRKIKNIEICYTGREYSSMYMFMNYIKQIIRNLDMLESLKIDTLEFDDEVLELLPNPDYLRELEIFECNDFDFNIKKLTGVTSISLVLKRFVEDNNILVHNIADNFSNLLSLSISSRASYSYLSNDSLIYLIGKCTNLTSLSLARTIFANEAFTDIIESIKTLKFLEVIDITYIKFLNLCHNGFEFQKMDEIYLLLLKHIDTLKIFNVEKYFQCITSEFDNYKHIIKYV